MGASDDAKKLQDMLDQTVQTVQKLTGPLTILATVQLAGEFYTKEERTELLARYESLRDQDQKAIDVANADIEAKADYQVKQASSEARQKTRGAMQVFEREHGLIWALWKARQALSQTN